MYEAGGGVEKAISWFRSAADQHDSYAEYNLGWAYESGLGVPKDTPKAVQWYSKAANGGNPEASARLAGLTAGNSIWGTLFRHFGPFSSQ
jgi:TPR repeat protein